MALFAVLAAGLTPSANADSTQRVVFRGSAVDARQNPLVGAHDVVLRYYAAGGKTLLFQECFAAVQIDNGDFELLLGHGAAAQLEIAGDLTTVFTNHPELEVEFEIGSVVQQPRIKVLPAGHSQESRALYAGSVSDDDKGHTKGYRVKSAQTAVQTAILRPAGSSSDPYYATNKSNPFLLDMQFLGVSQPLRDLPAYEPEAQTKGNTEGREINPIRHEDLVDEDGIPYGTRTVKIDDPLALESQRGSGRATPGMLVDFEGIPATGYAPPDTEGAVGPNHYVQVVNVSFRIYNKAGSPVTNHVNTNSIWSGAGGHCETTNNGDAIFLYDEAADRWVFTQFTYPNSNSVCFAVSTSGDPTGTFYLYQLNTQRVPDYYKLGVWPDPDNNAYFMGTNTGSGGQYDVYAIDRANLLAGTAPRPGQFFQNHANLLMPADLDGDTAPPAGSPGIFYTFRDGGESYFVPPSAVDTIDIWEFDVDWTTPANTTFTQVQQIVPPELDDFNWTVCGFFVSSCLQQPGTSQRLDSASWWPMQRLQYRNFGSYETLAGAWTVDVLASGDHAAPRWFEMRRSGGGSWVMDQQGSFAPDSKHRWMPSAALDGSGNMALGYSVMEASSTTYAGLRYATRAAGAADFDAEAIQINGSGSETGIDRWGDYASMEVDPSDDCTFWFTSEYVATTGSFSWNTRISSFKLPSCTGSLGLSVSPATQEVCASAGSATYDVTLVDPFIATTNLSVTGCPSGAACGFSPNPVVYPVTTSVITVIGLAGVAENSYTMTVTATDSVNPATTMFANVGLTVFPGNPAPPALTSPANGATDESGTPTFTWAAASGATTYDLEVATDAGFSNIVVSQTGLTATSYGLTSSLAPSTEHFWRVRAFNPCGPSSWSAVYSFTTATVICFSPGIAIPDNLPAGIDDSQSVALSGTLIDLDLELGVTHTWVGDLMVTLAHDASGTSVVLIDRPGVPASTYGCSGSNISVILDDESSDPVEDACASDPAIGGTLIPTNALSAFDGLELSGGWTLNVSDNVGDYIGTIDSWCLIPSLGPPAEPPFFADGFESGDTSAWTTTIP